MVVVQVTCTPRRCAASLRLAELRLAASAAAPAAVTEAAWRRSAGAAGGTRRPAAGTTVDAPTGPPSTDHRSPLPPPPLPTNRSSYSPGGANVHRTPQRTAENESSVATKTATANDSFSRILQLAPVCTPRLEPRGPPTTVRQRRGTAFSVRLTVTSILSSPEWALDRRTAD